MAVATPLEADAAVLEDGACAFCSINGLVIFHTSTIHLELEAARARAQVADRNRAQVLAERAARFQEGE